jgi:hypothetical protein
MTNTKQLLNPQNFRIEFHIRMFTADTDVADFRAEAEVPMLAIKDPSYDETITFESLFEALIHRPALIKFNEHTDKLMNEHMALVQKENASKEAPAPKEPYPYENLVADAQAYFRSNPPGCKSSPMPVAA